MDDRNSLVLCKTKEKRWNASELVDKPEYVTKNTVAAWALALNCDYCGYDEIKSKDLDKYDIIIANTNLEYLAYIRKLQESKPTNCKWVTLIEGDARDYLKPMEHIKEIFDNSDLINCINKNSLPLFKAMTDTKVEYIGIPYPASNIRKYSIPIKERKRATLICPKLLNRWNDYYVAKSLPLNYEGKEERISRNINNVTSNLLKGEIPKPNKYIDKAKELYNDDSLTISPSAFLKKYIIDASKYYIWINLDDRYTWGRFVLDAAALQIPIITTRSTGHGEDLFPETTLEDEFQIDKAIEIGKRLIEDKDFYNNVANIPIEKIEKYSRKNLKDKLLNLLYN